jgi:calcium/calmodulin-dependent protein kinase I
MGPKIKMDNKKISFTFSLFHVVFVSIRLFSDPHGRRLTAKVIIMTEEEVKFVTGESAHAELEETYKMGRVLGQGAFAKVKLATNKTDNSTWAVKIINRASLSASDSESLRMEMEILQKVSHRNIVQTKSIYDTSRHTYIVMECMSGGELFDRIVEKESYSELEARTAFWEICSAIQYCHQKGVVHRDLKPENILYNSPDEDGVLKLADFGLADVIQHDTMLQATCGTPSYIAPEILALAGSHSSSKAQGYGKEVDMWSAGVILYILICGFPPFYADDDSALFKCIKMGEFEYTAPYWDDSSEEVKDLISKLLVVDPAKRLSAEAALEHTWLSENFPHKTIHMDKSIVNMKKFNARRRLKGAVRAVMAARRVINK